MKICLVPQLDKWPVCVKYAQTPWGKAILLLFYAAALYLYDKISWDRNATGDWWLDVSIMLAIVSYLPTWRSLLLPLGALYWLCTYLSFKWRVVLEIAGLQGESELAQSQDFKVRIVAAVILFCFIYSKLAHVYRDKPFFRRPIIGLFAILFGLLFSVSYLPLSAALRVGVWAFIIVLTRYFWYLCYSLLESRNPKPKSFPLQFGHYFGFWSGGYLDECPIPKGAAYIREIEAKNSYQLAISQLKGLKLIIWALLLQHFTFFCTMIFHSSTHKIFGLFELPFRLNVPLYSETFQRLLAGNPFPWYIGWAAIICDKFIVLLKLCVITHVIVASCRMVGFNALRNTYKPLEVKSLLDYWNRFYFYFKELLVDLFFYPAFFRYFKRQPKLRLLFATFAAAAIGNLLSHVVLDIQVFYFSGILETCRGFANYLVYASLLSIGIWISQLRQHRAQAPVGFFRREILSRIGVWGFVILLHPLDYWLPDRSLKDMFKYLAYLFGLI